MESEENESDTPENDRYHVVILHGESQTELAEAVCENIQKINVGNSFQLVARTLDSIASPARTMMDSFNHVIENSLFLMFFRCAEFFEDMMNTFTVSAGLQDRIQHTDPKRHWTFIPVDIEKKVKIKGNPIINSLNGITISLSGDLGRNDERKLKELFCSKLDILNQSRESGGSGFEVQEVIVQNQTRQVRDICKLVSSADQSADRQHVLHNYDNAQNSSIVTTSGNQDNSDTSTSDKSGNRSESESHPKTRIALATMAVPLEPATRRCESAPVEGGGRQTEDSLFSGSGEEHARSCHSSLEGDRGRNKKRNLKEEEGRGRGGRVGSGAVIAQRQTSTNNYSNLPNNQLSLSEVSKSKNRVPTPSSPYLPSSVGKGVDSEIDSNVPTIPRETLPEGRQATTSGSQFASDNRKGEKGSIRGQGQPTGSEEYPPRGGEGEMRRDNGRSDTKDRGKNASPDSAKKTSEEALTVPLRESLHFPQGYPLSNKRPGSFEDHTDIFGSFPELDDVMSEMSKCSLTPPSSPKFRNDRSNQSSLQYDCATSYYSDQEENNGHTAASRHQQNQGPRDESPQRQQLHQALHQKQWQQNYMLPRQQQAWEQQPQPQHHYGQPLQQQEGEGFVELNGRPDLAADRGLNRSRSSSEDTDSGRGTI